MYPSDTSPYIVIVFFVAVGAILILFLKELIVYCFKDDAIFLFRKVKYELGITLNRPNLKNAHFYQAESYLRVCENLRAPDQIKNNFLSTSLGIKILYDNYSELLQPEIVKNEHNKKIIIIHEGAYIYRVLEYKLFEAVLEELRNRRYSYDLMEINSSPVI